MKTIAAIVISAVLLTACGASGDFIYPHDSEIGSDICKDRGGFRFMVVDRGDLNKDEYKVYCENGDTIKRRIEKKR